MPTGGKICHGERTLLLRGRTRPHEGARGEVEKGGVKTSELADRTKVKSRQTNVEEALSLLAEGE